MTLDVVATGSTGNAYILTAGKDKLLLDCGVRYKEILYDLGHDTKSVVGCLVTHEHNDHTQALYSTIRAGIDCYMTAGTAEAKDVSEGHRVHIVKATQAYDIGRFTIYPFETEHDAAEPVGYLISYQPTGEKLLYATDTFYLRYSFKGIHYMAVECNYCRGVAHTRYVNGEINKAMYDRLMTSHFSLDNLMDWLKASDLSTTRHIVLLHMSAGNSDERKMVRDVHKLTGIPTTAASSGIRIELNLHPF